MVAAAGAGPRPIPQQHLTADRLAEAIRFCLTPSANIAANAIAAYMRSENGVKSAVRSFHANLPLETLQCDILRDRSAAFSWKRGDTELKLSKLATGVLLEHLKVDYKKLGL